MSDSTRTGRSRKAKPKPTKPYEGFPLFCHATGRWAKKVRGKLVYFGRIDDDPDGARALERWHAEQADLIAGRIPKSRRVKAATIKVSKPSPDFPLFPHANGRWCKKVKGRAHYFGKTIDDPNGDAALILWNEQKDDLLAGRLPRAKRGGLRLRDLCNRYLTTKLALLDNDELSPRHFRDLKATCKLLLDFFGSTRAVDDLHPDDFGRLRAHLAKRRGAVTLGNEIQRIRSVLKFGYDEGLIDRPIRYGQSFAKPSRKVIRKLKATNGAKMFEAAEVQALVAKAGVPLKAMVLLGINCGFGQSDCSELPLSAVDLKGRWIDFPRPKSGIARRCYLWPETLKALREAIAARPEPADEEDDGLVFLTTFGRRWVRTHRNDDKAEDESGPKDKRAKGTKIVPVDSVLQEFVKLIKAAGVSRHGFYSLRHTFRTVADGARDHVATGLIMGHHDDSMAGVYRERVDDDRLKAVANHVRTWFTKGAKRVARKPRAK